MEKMILHIENLKIIVIKVGTIAENFYMIYELNTDYCTHGLIIIDRVPENMDKETLEEFITENFNRGESYCGTLEEMEEELKRIQYGY